MTTVSDLQARALELTDWLASMPRTYAAPVVVKIGRETYAGATYVKVLEAAESTPAYAAGERFYSSSMMYVLGRLPYSYRRRRSTAYRIAGGRFPWYIAGWYQTEPANEYHPFGSMFLLSIDKAGVLTDDAGVPYRELALELIG